MKIFSIIIIYLICADLTFGNSNPPGAPIIFGDPGIDDAEAIASQDETYINFLQVGEWLNNRWLYDKLAKDETLRNSSSILSSFYNNFENTVIGNIEQTDLAMNVLFDFSGNENDMIVLYNNAIDRNNEIVSADDWEMNEATMNTITLHLGRYGKDSITELQKLELEVLANTCPFIGGSAVYKARTLWTLFNPMAQYNDRLICIQGANKNGSSYINLDSLYEAQTNTAATLLANNMNISHSGVTQEIIINRSDSFEDIVLYPNPAKNYLMVEYHNKKGEFILFDAVGKIVVKTQLQEENKLQKINFPVLSNGVYSYKIILEDGMYNGKINIVQHE